MKLKYCKECIQMTNHNKDQCLKCQINKKHKDHKCIEDFSGYCYICGNDMIERDKY